MVTKKEIEEVLDTIPDPEIGISLMELGLIYNSTIDKEGNVEILMTLTSVGCPLFDEIVAPIEEKVGALKGVKKVTVNLTFEPPWSIDKVSENAKALLGF
ncbi:MAG: metal-sulfur cluster assembly factor [Patescibacteria group bacterium]